MRKLIDAQVANQGSCNLTRSGLPKDLVLTIDSTHRLVLVQETDLCSMSMLHWMSTPTEPRYVVKLPEVHAPGAPQRGGSPDTPSPATLGPPRPIAEATT